MVVCLWCVVALSLTEYANCCGAGVGCTLVRLLHLYPTAHCLYFQVCFQLVFCPYFHGVALTAQYVDCANDYTTFLMLGLLC